jgi:hypothetical protein
MSGKNARTKPAAEPAKRRKFKVVFSVEVEIEIDDDVVADAMSEDFRKSHYHFTDAAAVAQHLAFNFACWKSRLSSLDGFAQHADGKAKLVDDEWTMTDVTEEEV